jgi:hypothetical protein
VAPLGFWAVALPPDSQALTRLDHATAPGPMGPKAAWTAEVDPVALVVTTGARAGAGAGAVAGAWAGAVRTGAGAGVGLAATGAAGLATGAAG